MGSCLVITESGDYDDYRVNIYELPPAHLSLFLVWLDQDLRHEETLWLTIEGAVLNRAEGRDPITWHSLCESAIDAKPADDTIFMSAHDASTGDWCDEVIRQYNQAVSQKNRYRLAMHALPLWNENPIIVPDLLVTARAQCESVLQALPIDSHAEHWVDVPVGLMMAHFRDHHEAIAAWFRGDPPWGPR